MSDLQGTLSSSLDSKYCVALKKPYVYFDPCFLEEDIASQYYEDLLQSIKWETTSKINRWVSLHNNIVLEVDDNEQENNDYQYRDAPGAAKHGFPETIQAIQQAAQDWYWKHKQRKVEFNVCLLNYYENGQQRIGWHSDREEIGRTTPIASVSLGATRQLQIRNKTEGPSDRVTIDMPNGSLIIMENQCQHEYLHSVPKQPAVEEGRINLTFRCKEFTTDGERMHEQHDKGLSNITSGVSPITHAWSSLPSTYTESTSKDSVFGDDVPMDILDPAFPDIIFLLKTNLGTERYCGAEIQEILLQIQHDKDEDVFDCNDWHVIARPLQLDGFVACCTRRDINNENCSKTYNRIKRALLTTKSAHHLLEFHTEFPLEHCFNDEVVVPEMVTGEMLYEHFKKLLLQRNVIIPALEDLANTGGGTFRASCDRIGGPHAFQHPEVEREIGGAIAEYYENKKIYPKMEDHDVEIRIEIIGYRVVVGTQINVTDLSKDRHFLKFRNAVSLKTNIAYVMVRLGNILPGQTVLDPFCGSGTLLLEAMEVFQKKIFCVGLDVSKRSAVGARENALAENCGPEICRFSCSDARGLRKHVSDESVDALITNLPWGIQTGHHNSVTELGTMYEIFLRTAWYILKPGARVVMLVLRGLQLMRIVRKLNGRYRLLSVNVVRTTNNLPSIFVIEKIPFDTVRDSIKGQLAHLQQYVSVGPDMYRALHSEQIDED